MLHRRFLIAAGLVVTAVLAPTTSGTAATNSGQHRLLLPYAGSSRYLLYIKGQPNDSVRQAVLHGSVYALSRSGRTERVGSLDQHHRYLISGSLLVVAETSPDFQGTTIHWRNLRSGKRADVQLKAPGGTYLNGFESAAPHGWIYATGGGYGCPVPITLWYQTIDGHISKLGTPAKYNCEPTVSAGRHRVVVSGLENHGSQISWASYKEWGAFHPLVPEATGDNRCSSPSRGWTACYSDKINGRISPRMQLVSLNGLQPVAVTRRCITTYGDPIRLRAQAVWIVSRNLGGCTARGQLVGLTSRGELRRSKTRFNFTTTYGSQGLTRAFGEIIATSRSNRTIYALRSVTAKPKVLVHTR